MIIGSGSRALLFRYAAGMRHMDAVDQLSLEWAGCFRHYYAAMMRTLCVGEASSYHRHLFSVVREALSPRRPVGEVDDAHRCVLDAGFEKMAPAVLEHHEAPTTRGDLVIRISVAYVLCRIEDDSSLPPQRARGHHVCHCCW